MSILVRPESLAEATSLLAARDYTILSGGTDVFPALVDRPPPAAMLDVSHLPEIRGISRRDGAIRIGGATTWSEIIAAPLPRAFDALKAAAREVGSVQIQNRGTIAGNLCNASPAADGVPPLLALDAEVELVSSCGTRRLALADFILGNRRTALAPDEILSAILVPEPACVRLLGLPEARGAALSRDLDRDGGGGGGLRRDRHDLRRANRGRFRLCRSRSDCRRLRCGCAASRIDADLARSIERGGTRARLRRSTTSAQPPAIAAMRRAS